MSNDCKPNEQLKDTELQILAAYHKIILEAMRSREEAILKFLALFGLPITGYIWLLLNYENPAIRIVGAAIGTVVLLMFGACYVLTLSYNYRYLQVLTTRAERKLGAYNPPPYKEQLSDIFKDIMPKEWDLTITKVEKWQLWNFGLAPEMFKVMLWLSLFLICCVSITALYILFSQLQSECTRVLVSILSGLVATLIAFIILGCVNNHYRDKIKQILPKE